MRLKRINFSNVYLRTEGLTPKIMGAMFDCLPQDIAIVNWGEDPSMHMSYWIVTSEQFDEVEFGGLIPEAILKFTKDEGGYIRCELEDLCN